MALPQYSHHWTLLWIPHSLHLYHPRLSSHSILTPIFGFLSLGQIPPPFKPQVTSDTDTRYFDVLFTGEMVNLTPPGNEPAAAAAEVLPGFDDDVDSLPYFEQFSYHGSKNSLASSRQSGMSFETSWTTWLAVGNHMMIRGTAIGWSWGERLLFEVVTRGIQYLSNCMVTLGNFSLARILIYPTHFIAHIVSVLVAMKFVRSFTLVTTSTCCHVIDGSMDSAVCCARCHWFTHSPSPALGLLTAGHWSPTISCFPPPLFLSFFLFLFMDVVLTVVFLKTASALLVFLQFCNSFINDYILPVFWTCILLMTCLASEFFLSQTKLLVSLFHKKNFVTLAPPPPQPFFQFLWKQSRCVLWIWLKATTLKPFFEFKNKTK